MDPIDFWDDILTACAVSLCVVAGWVLLLALVS